jgi:hypothetical protein
LHSARVGRHTPTRFYLCAAPFLHRSCRWPVVTDYSSFVPSSWTIAYHLPTRHIRESPANAGFEFRVPKLFPALLCPLNVQLTINVIGERRVEPPLLAQSSTQGMWLMIATLAPILRGEILTSARLKRPALRLYRVHSEHSTANHCFHRR